MYEALREEVKVKLGMVEEKPKAVPEKSKA